MTEDQFKDYKKLVDELNRYSHEYHVNNNSVINDETYDRLFRELLCIESSLNEKDIVPYSPTQRVGEIVKNNLPKV